MITLKKTTDGRFIGADKDSLIRLSKIAVGEVIRVKPEKREVKQRRSTKQNSYYWAVVIETLYQSLDAGLDRDQIHTAMKAGCFGVEKVLGCVEMPKRSTKDLNTEEFEEFMSWIRQWASEMRGIYIPLPNETEYDYD